MPSAKNEFSFVGPMFRNGRIAILVFPDSADFELSSELEVAVCPECEGGGPLKKQKLLPEAEKKLLPEAQKKLLPEAEKKTTSFHGIACFTFRYSLKFYLHALMCFARRKKSRAS